MTPKEIKLLISFGSSFLFAYIGFLYGSLIPRNFLEGAFWCFLTVGLLYMITGQFDTKTKGGKL